MIGILIVSIIIAAIIIMYINRICPTGYDIYVIPKGKQYSRRNGSIVPWKIELCRQVIDFEVIFGKGCDYDSTKIEDDIHKLYGMCFGYNWHYNSVRIGWRYNSIIRKIELFEYSYIRGMRQYHYLTTVKQFETVKIIIASSKIFNDVIIEIEQKGENLKRLVPKIGKGVVRWKMFPYFGGNVVAPNSMKIYIKQKRA